MEFVGESAEDCGGPLREFWMLLSKEFEEQLCRGPPGNAIVIHDARAMQLSFCYYAHCILSGRSSNCLLLRQMADPLLLLIW